MDLSYVLHETHTRAITAVGYNAGRRELMIGYEGMLLVLTTTWISQCILHLLIHVRDVNKDSRDNLGQLTKLSRTKKRPRTKCARTRIRT